MLVRVLYHDHCFDGAASAAYFSRFIAGPFIRAPSSGIPGWRTRRRSCSTQSLFDGDENAIVDFKYSSDPEAHLVVRPSPERLLTPEDADAFPPGHQRQKAVRSHLQILHRVYPRMSPASGSASRPRTWTTWSTGR